jgi:hypothetical protein
MRKILAITGALILALLMVPGAASANTSPTTCHSKSGIGYDIKVCSNFDWRLQNDGSGVYLEGLNVWVAKGCGDLEATKLSSLWVGIETNASPSGASLASITSCGTTYRDTELKGMETGASEVNFTMDVNVNGGGSDYAATHTCDIRPNQADVCSTWHN